ncbi:MAG: hypothetical protein R3E63_02035 [Pseudomonadales bacterium]
MSLKLEKKKKICVYTYLPQDVDLAIPLVKTLEKFGLDVFIYVDEQLIASSPRSLRKYNQEKIKYVRHPLRKCVLFFRKHWFDPVWQPASSIFISIVESNLPPHKLGKDQTLKAIEKRKITATYQHGIDNIGLNYSDVENPIQDVTFYSDIVWIWGDKEKLHKDINSKNLNKVVSVGCIKAIEAFDSPALPNAEHYEKVIGVFENLHWLRYSEEYRDTFLKYVYAAAKEFTNMLFVIKPHHTGRWLTGKLKKSIKLESDNILILDPKDSTWEKFTAPAIIKSCDKVLSTPSTVVLDACLQGKPVAVMGDEDCLSNYNGIQNIRNYDSMRQFLMGAENTNDGEEFLLSYGCNDSDAVGRKMADSLFEAMKAQ